MNIEKSISLKYAYISLLMGKNNPSRFAVRKKISLATYLIRDVYDEIQNLKKKSLVLASWWSLSDQYSYNYFGYERKSVIDACPSLRAPRIPRTMVWGKRRETYTLQMPGDTRSMPYKDNYVQYA